LDEYKQASAALQASVTELQQSTEKVCIYIIHVLARRLTWTVLSVQITAHVRRIEAVEKDLKSLAAVSATKEDASRVRAEMKKLYDGLHVGSLRLLVPHELSFTSKCLEFLDLRAHVWGIRECCQLPEFVSAADVKAEQDVHALSKKDNSVRVV
jgi:hypothetical protein